MRCGFTDRKMARARCPRREIIDRCASGPSKRVANRDAIGGRPIAAELEEISHVTNINLRPDKNPALNIDGKSRAQVCLEMARAGNKLIGRASE